MGNLTNEKRKRGNNEKINKPLIKSVNIEKLALSLCQKYEKELRAKRFLSAKSIFNLIGAGLFTITEFYPSNIIRMATPFIKDLEANECWKRFNIPYLKRTIKRLEKAKVIVISEERDKQVIKITEKGKTRILKNAINDIKIEKPSFWDKKWWLVSYDLPEKMGNLRDGIRKYLLYLGFFPIHKSVYLHAYPCNEQIEFLREYFGIGEYIRIFKVDWIENNKEFKEYFDL